MDKNQDRLDQLFQSARTQEPKVSLNDTKKVLLAGTSIGIIAALVKWFSASTKLIKASIMLSTITAATVGVVLTVNSLSVTSNKLETPQYIPEDKIELAPEEVIEFQKSSSLSKPNLEINVNEIISGPKETVELEKKKDNPFFKAFHGIISERKDNEITTFDTNNTIVNQSQKHVDKVDERVVFNIKGSTTDQELDKIKQAAEDAGIRFAYKVKRKKGKLVKLNLELSLNNEEYLSTQSSISINSGDGISYQLGWILDENKRAKAILLDEDLDETSLMIWADSLVESLDLTALKNDALDEVFEDFEELGKELTLEFKTLNEDLKIAIQDNDLTITDGYEDWQKDVEKWANEYRKNLDKSDFENLSSDELEKELKALEVELEKLMKQLKTEIDK